MADANKYTDIIYKVFLQNQFPARIQSIPSSDPSSIILYTELGAFPIFYPSVLHGPWGMASHYHRIIHDEKNQQVVHTDRTYDHLLPVLPGAIEELKK